MKDEMICINEIKLSYACDRHSDIKNNLIFYLRQTDRHVLNINKLN